MTLHVAAVYFDDQKRTCGILLGADRLGYNYPPSIYTMLQQEPNNQNAREQWRIIEEKSFFGEHTIGFSSGTFRASAEGYRQELRTLDAYFDNIEPNARYQQNPLLEKAHSYVLSIVRWSEDMVELYRVYDKTKKGKRRPHVKRDFSLRRSAYEQLHRTPYWSELNTHKGPLLGFGPGRYNRQMMLAHLITLMTRTAQERPESISAPFDIYAIDFEGIKKVA